MRTQITSCFLISLALLPLKLMALSSPDPERVDTLLGYILNAADILITILITLSFVVFGWGIVKLIANAGDPQKIKDAKGIMLWGVIGIFILASMYGIITFIRKYTGITSDNPPIEAPQFEKQ